MFFNDPKPCLLVNHNIGADSGNRIHDLLITNEMLYQLSYDGIILPGNPRRQNFLQPEPGPGEFTVFRVNKPGRLMRIRMTTLTMVIGIRPGQRSTNHPVLLIDSRMEMPQNHLVMPLGLIHMETSNSLTTFLPLNPIPRNAHLTDDPVSMPTEILGILHLYDD